MFKFAKKATSAVIAGAVALGTLALYPNGEKGKVNAATLYDSASAVNFATILGRAVDYGIVANKFQQKAHMETTYAVKSFENVTGDVDEVDFIDNQTAQFLIGAFEGNYPISFGQKQTAAYYNLEASAQVLNGFNGTTSGNFRLDYPFNTEGKSSFVWREGSNVSGNVGSIINNVATSRSVDIHNRAINPDYALSSDKMVVNPWGVTINIDEDEFENKVVYVNVTHDMLSGMAQSDGLKINKRSSTIVVFNIEADVEGIEAKKIRNVDTDEYDVDNNGIHLNKMQVNVGGAEIHSTSGSMGGNTNDTGNTNKQVNDEICEKIIWNIMGPRTVELENTAGTFLMSDEGSNGCVTGSCAGWVVAGGHFENNKEWHYIYTGGSQEAPTDLKGQMHFAIRKAFTKEYAAKNSVVEDKTIITKAEDYEFEFYKSNSSYELLSLIDTGKSQATNTVNLPTLKFFTSQEEADANDLHDNYIPEGESNAKIFNFVIIEKDAGAIKTASSTSSENPTPKIENSKGYINVELKVINKKINSINVITYEISSETFVPDEAHPGQFIKYAENKNVPMSGVQFDLGAFYNKVLTPGYLKVTKSIVGDADPNELTITVKEGDKVLETYVIGDNLNKNDTTGLYESEVLIVDDATKTYTVEESLFDVTGYEVKSTYKINAGQSADYKSPVDVTSVSTDPDNPTAVNFINTYTKILGALKVSKSVDTTNAQGITLPSTYSFYVQNDKGEYLQNNGTFTDDEDKATYTINNNGTINYENVPYGTYTVTEIGGSVDGYTLTTTYTYPNNGDSASITKNGDEKEVTIVNAYKKDEVKGVLHVEKTVDTTNATGISAPTSFSFYVQNANKEFLLKDGTTGTQAAATYTIAAGETFDYANVPEGTYTVTEVGGSVDGYKLTTTYTYPNNASSASITQNGDEKTITIVNTYEKEYGKLEISKELATGAPTAASSKEFTFIVTGPNNYKETVKITGADKATLEGLEPGSYTVTEDKTGAAIANYKLTVSGDDGVAKTVEGGKTTQVKITNTYEKEVGKLEITKELATGAPTAASSKEFTFTVTGPNNYKETVKITGADKATLEGLEPGSYTVTEDKTGAAIANYKLTVSGDDGVAKTVEGGKTTQVKITNTYEKEVGKLEISKELATGAPSTASNKEFSFTVTGPNNYKETVKITGADKTTLENLEPGSYTVTEDKDGAAIANYKLTVSGDDGVAKTVEADKTTKVTITNTYEDNSSSGKGKLEITKSLATGAPSAATTKTYSFTVTGPNNYSETVTIKGADKTTLENLEPGSYTVTEDETGAAIENYDLTVSGDNKVAKTVSAGETTKVTITNTYEDNSTSGKGKLEISKALATGAPSAASTKTYSFTVTGPNNYKQTVTIKGADKTTLENLEPGSYTVTEDETGAAIENYDLTVSGDNKVAKTVEADKTTKVTITNTYEDNSTSGKGKLEISKALATGAPSAASTKTYSFTVTGPNNYKQTVTIKGADKTTLENLEPGSYTVTEDETGAAIENYDLTVSGDNKVAKTVSAGETTKVTITNTYEDNSSSGKGKLEISKELATGAPTTASNKEFSFTVTGPNNYKETVKITGADKTTLENLEPGSYTVTEDETGAAIENYDLTVSGDNKVAKTVSAGETTKVTITNTYEDNSSSGKGKIEISKELATGAPTEASNKEFSFTVTGPSNYKETVKITGADKTTLENLEPGSYTVTEDETGAAIANYKLTVSGDNKVAKTVSAGETTKVTITNTYEDNSTSGKGKLEITKSLATGAPSDAKTKTYSFKVTGPNNFEKTVTVTGAGKTTLENLEPGSYTVTEDKDGAAIANYDLTVSGDDGVAKTVEADETTKVTITNTYSQKKGSLKITKVLGVGAPSAASSKVFSFTVTGPDNYKETVKITGEDTVTLKNLTPGSYKVTEDKDGAAIENYTLDVTGDDGKTISVVSSGTAACSITNTYSDNSSQTYGELTISKTLAVGAPSSASSKEFSFTVTGPSNYKETVKITGAGTATLKKLEPGSYTVTEDKTGAAIANYKLTVSGDDGVAKTVEAGKTTQVKITNKYEDNSTSGKGKLEITKKLATGAPSAASSKTYSFTVTGPDGYEATVTINGASKATLENLEPGSYTVTENKTGAAIANYKLTVSGDDGVAKTVEADNTTQVAITNKYEDNSTTGKGSLEITKSLATGAPSSASTKTFSFTVTGPNNYKETVTITGASKTTLTGLTPGSYTVTENQTGAAIANYKLTVSGDDGVAKTVEADKTTKVAITNKYEDNSSSGKGSLEITKELATGAPSAASTKTFSFTVTGPDDYKETVTITGAGKTTLTGLTPGSYTVTENQTGAAIANYKLTVSGDDGVAKTVEADKTTKVTITNKYEDSNPSGDDLEVSFEKKDEQNKLIAEAELTLENLDGFDMSNVYVMQNGKKIESKLSADKTAISFNTVDTSPSIVCGLKAGRYRLTETVTPKKYETADAIVFTLAANGDKTDEAGKVILAGSPIVMIDRADPNYKPDDSDVISANRKPVPATGEETSLTSIIGVALICTCAVALSGLGIYRVKRKRS